MVSGETQFLNSNSKTGAQDPPPDSTDAVGTHPTGMHSCFTDIFNCHSHCVSRSIECIVEGKDRADHIDIGYAC